MTESLTTPATLSDNLEGKVVIADTSSLLISGVSFLSLVRNCQLIIPAIVVKELEDKRGSSILGYMAREWLHLLERVRVSAPDELSTGHKLAEYENVLLRVEPNHSTQSSLPQHLQDGSHDSTILSVALNVSKDSAMLSGYSGVALLSNDLPMRLHATLDLKLEAYEFNATQVLNAKPFSGYYTVDLDNYDYQRFTDELSEASGKVSEELSDFIETRLPNDPAVSYGVHFTVEGEPLRTVVLASDGGFTFLQRKAKASGITGKTVEQDMALAFLKKSAEEVPVVSVGGGAGTGKTLLTVATAISELKAGNYEKIVVFRSLHEMGNGQEMGFLPGGVDEKMEAWAGAVLDAVDVLARVNKPLKRNATPADLEKQKLVAKGFRDMIEVQPITYLRGRSLSGTYIILDEAQNFSRSELLNIISRVGAGSKIVALWDAAQVDNRYLSSGKNADIWSVVNDMKHSDLFAHVTLSKTERSRVAELASALLEKN